MANTKKVSISSKNMPAVGPNNSYLVRYRVISEDGSTASEWTVPVEVFGLPPIAVSGSLSISTNKDAVLATWGDANDRPSYDIFVRFGDDSGTTQWQEWFYHGTSAVHSYSFLIPTSIEVRTNPGTLPATYSTVEDPHIKKVQVRIQIASTGNQLSDDLDIFISSETNI